MKALLISFLSIFKKKPIDSVITSHLEPGWIQNEDFIREANKQLTRDEGRRNRLYKCTAGKLTIGIGWNIEDNGLPDDIIDQLFKYSLKMAYQDLEKIFGKEYLDSISLSRVLALTNLSFNLGYDRFSKFKNTIKYLKEKNWRMAGKNLRLSLWYKQVGKRAERVISSLERDVLT